MAFEVTPEFKKQLTEDGVALAPGLLDHEQLERVRELLEWSLAHAGPLFSDSSTDAYTYRVENFNPKAQRRYRDIVSAPDQWAAFGFIAAEAELARARP